MSSLGCKAFMHRHEFSCSLFRLLKFNPRRFQEWSRVSYTENSPGIYHSVSLLRFLFLSQVQVFSREISFICRLKYPYSCFSFYLFFLVIAVPFTFMLPTLFLVNLNSLYLLFFMHSYPCFLQCWRVLFLLLFLTHIVCLCHLSDVRPNASS